MITVEALELHCIASVLEIFPSMLLWKASLLRALTQISTIFTTDPRVVVLASALLIKHPLEVDGGFLTS